MKPIVLLPLILLVLGFSACEDSTTTALPETISVRLQENGGMMPYSTEILLSTVDESYVAFFADGVHNKISITPTHEELYTLVEEMQAQHFAQIKTRTTEALDRGGSSIHLSLNGVKVSVSNMGFSFVKDKYLSAYTRIEERIYALAKKQLALLVPKVEVELDESLLRREWHTSWSMNRNLFVEQSTLSTNDGFQEIFYAQALVENSVDIRILSNAPETLGENIFDWHQKVVIPEGVKKIRFALEEGDIVVRFDEEQQDEVAEAIQMEILEKQNLNELSQASRLQIDLTKEGEDADYEPFRLNISYPGKASDEAIPLVNTYGSFVDTYADIHYQLMNTGQPDAPYLLFYSGQAGDEYNTPGLLVLFSETQKIAELPLHDGNRINAKIIELRPDWIKIQEALICHQPIETTIAFSRAGLHRMEGFFPKNTVYPTENGTYELKTDLEVFTDQTTKLFKAGTSISLTLEWIDFDLETVFLKINDTAATLPLKQFKALELVQSMAGAKCEMG